MRAAFLRVWGMRLEYISSLISTGIVRKRDSCGFDIVY